MSSRHGDEIRVLNWQGYGTDLDWAVQPFEEATGHTVVHDYFNSEQEMLTKLRTNPGALRRRLINAAFTGQAYEEGLIQPIDTSAIANYSDIAPRRPQIPSSTATGARSTACPGSGG
jgi:spermidine/putrescine transport system substrate-binding protein